MRGDLHREMPGEGWLVQCCATLDWVGEIGSLFPSFWLLCLMDLFRCSNDIR